jgi:hypothetical protein
VGANPGQEEGAAYKCDESAKTKTVRPQNQKAGVMK